MTSPLNFAIIGCGRIGKLHAENFTRHIGSARLAAVADVNLDAAREVARGFNVPQARADYRELLADSSIDAVAICSATNTHARMIQEAAAAGKHIFCEKPIDLDLGRIQHALDAVTKAGMKLQVGFNRRFDPSFAKVRELVASGKIGQPHIIRITSRDPAPPPIEYLRGSGGIFLDMTIHDFDMVRFLSGSEAEEIYAVGGALIDPEIGRAGDVDTAIVTMRLKSGALATIDNSRKAVYGYDQRVEVFGSTGLAMVSNRTPDNHILVNTDGVHSATPQYFFLERYQESYVAEMQEFVDCLLHDKEPSISGKDGLIPVTMGLAATKSLKERRPVKMSEIAADNVF
ncbi:MAG: inositol 2-dehydrogenase [Verrucomicrobia bacterium]|nr:MAG: inositol 2-dehydrogenase [Verrucomicrobiota bacterium]